MTNNPNTYRDSTKPEEHPPRHNAEAGKNEKLMQQLEALTHALNHHQPVTKAMINDIRDGLKNITVRTSKGDLALDDPAMQKNMEVWKNILNRDVSYVDLISLTDAVAAMIVQSGGMHWLYRLTHITDEQARILAESRSSKLDLSGLTELTEGIAEALGNAKCDSLHLDGLTDITVSQARALARFNGRALWLQGFTHLRDEIAEALAGCQAQELLLLNLTSLSDTSAEHLAPIREKMKGVNITVKKQLDDAASRLGLT